MNLVKEFKDRFDNQDIRAVRSPLRICPIGAHSDHQGGKVTGMALDSSIDFVYSPNDEGDVKVYSLEFPEAEEFHLGDEFEFVPQFWGNYLRGAVYALQKDFDLTKGVNGVISGRMPIGGLSSSAAVISAYLMALCDVNDIELSKMDYVKYSSQAEREFVGLKNGILDQSANLLSEDDHLMVMDCSTYEYELIPKSDELADFEIITVYSGVSGALTDSGFNNRTDECRVSGWLLEELDNDNNEEIKPLEEMQLRDIPRDVYEKYKDNLPGRFGRRAKHYYTEQDRVQRGAEAWAEGDIEKLGQMMFESGDSTFFQYETGIPEMKTIFDTLRETEGVYGARPSGAGFRGSVIGIVDPKHKEAIKAKIDEVYPKAHPEHKDTYEVNFCKTADGASYIKNLEDL